MASHDGEWKIWLLKVKNMSCAYVATLLVATLIIVPGCSVKKEKTLLPPTIQSVPKSDMTDLASADRIDSSADPVAEWRGIWQNRDQLKALRDFKVKYGIYIETPEKEGLHSVLVEEGPCDAVYMSLVTDTKAASESVWEITSKGKVVREWHPGTETFVGLDGDNIFRRISYFENPDDHGFLTKNMGSRSHAFVLRIAASGEITVLPEETAVPKVELEPIECPPTPAILSDYKYCVKDAITERLFVLQQVCT